MAALTTDALWIQDAWQLRQVPLRNLQRIETALKGKEVVLTFLPEVSPEKLILAFPSAAAREDWNRKLQVQQSLLPETPSADRYLPEGVALVQRASDIPHVGLGRVTFTEHTPREAERGLQLRAGIRGADAVIDVETQKCPEMGWRACRLSGLAVRVEESEDRQRLRLRGYAEKVDALVKRILLVLAIQAALLTFSEVVCASFSPFYVPTGQTPEQALVSVGQGLGLIYAWPLVMLALVWLFRWPQLLRIAGIAVLVAMTGRGLVLILAHFLAFQGAEDALAGKAFWPLVDPVDWAFILAGVLFCVRAWRLARDAKGMLPPHAQPDSTARKRWGRGLLALTSVYALALLSFVAVARYQASAYLAQPGFDARREEEALRALNEGSVLANKGELVAADRSLQRSLQIWEELTKGRSVPAAYRRNLAMTLYDLGWIREKQRRGDEAEKYYTRAVAIGDELAGEPALDRELSKTLDDARQALASLHGGRDLKALEEKDQAAARKYEEAQVQAEKGDAGAATLYREAIATWEEILPRATNEQYRRAAVVRLATAYLLLGELKQKLGDRSQSEAALKKAIEYGEKAVAQEPDRPLTKHNLEVARRMLDGLHELAHQEEIARLWSAERFADAFDLFTRRIEDEEQQLRSGKDRETATQRLAYRLDRFAWFLAHCPDGRVRDTKAAVKHAARATELQPDVGDYWYTLAMVRYRDGQWRDSLAALDKVKTQEGDYDASAWLLVAMNRHQLKQKEDARAALRKAGEWMATQQRKAEGNALLRFQYETIRPSIEALKKEAENLIEGKDPAGERVG
jgi:tetratricopeptide (TPR) repeat protein